MIQQDEVDRLVDSLSDPSWEFRIEAATSLAKLGDIRGTEVLGRELSSETFHIRQAAALDRPQQKH